ncbi:MAG TPA: hypothetical protein VGQ88_03330, partial [Burkholderiales bacterium]|nr:hypothetical protein [Burkholderiales bacterium]
LRSFGQAAISDAAVVALAAKISVVDDPQIDPNAIEPTRVKVTLRNGRVIGVASDTIKGSPQEPMSEDELLAKLRGCLEFGLGAKRADIDRLADAVMKLETAADVAAVIVGEFPQSYHSEKTHE